MTFLVINDSIYSSDFGNLHAKAIDEIWYKSAVLQHQTDNKAFVYSVPFDVGDNPDTLVTGSYALFPSDAGMEAPGSVVGFQFSHAALRKRLENVGNKASVSKLLRLTKKKKILLEESCLILIDLEKVIEFNYQTLDGTNSKNQFFSLTIMFKIVLA